MSSVRSSASRSVRTGCIAIGIFSNGPITSSTAAHNTAYIF